jgi:hypothetical protein
LARRGCTDEVDERGDDAGPTPPRTSDTDVSGLYTCLHTNPIESETGGKRGTERPILQDADHDFVKPRRDAGFRAERRARPLWRGVEPTLVIGVIASSRRKTMPILLWLLGVPIPVIILLLLFWH